MNWLRVSLRAQAVLAVYFQAVQWFPLGRWNYQPEPSAVGPFSNLPLIVLAAQGRLTPRAVVVVVAAALPFALFWLAYTRRWRWLMWLQVVGYSLWLAIEMSWWVRYATRRSDSQVELYQRTFGQATQLLPSFGRHLPPDGAHLVLHLLLAAVVVSTVLGLLRPVSPKSGNASRAALRQRGGGAPAKDLLRGPGAKVVPDGAPATTSAGMRAAGRK